MTESTPPTPHLTELLDLQDVVDAASIAYVRAHATPNLGPEHLDSDIRGMIYALDPVERQEFRTIVLRVAYAGARAIAEQAYARAWNRARQLVDERTGEADETLGTLDTDPTAPLPDGYEFELNPFAEGQVIV